MRRLVLAATCLAAIAQAAPARADVIFSTLAPSGTYVADSGLNVSGPTSGAGFQTVGMQFTSSATLAVTRIDIALTHFDGTNAATVSLWTDAGDAPGVQLGSWAVSNQPAYGSSNSLLTTIAGITGITLQAGASYFLVAAAANDDTDDVWNINDNNLYGGLYTPTDGYFAEQSMGAFEITGTPVPEPATLALLGPLAAGFGLRGRATARRRQRG